MAVAALGLPLPPAHAVPDNGQAGSQPLSQSYGDWNVVCPQQQQQPGDSCRLVHQQVHPETGSAALTIVLFPPSSPADPPLRGRIVMPFGLSFRHGLRLQIDEKPPQEAIPFKTCFPSGCIVPLTFDADTVDSLTAGTRLSVQAKQAGDEQTVVIRASLLGLGDAIAQVGE